MIINLKFIKPGLRYFLTVVGINLTYSWAINAIPMPPVAVFISMIGVLVLQFKIMIDRTDAIKDSRVLHIGLYGISIACMFIAPLLGLLIGLVQTIILSTSKTKK